ncbi:S-adenosylmethionine decarboxylase related protein [Paenibacillus sp. 32352]|uniref:S-adenosylmethionine decarboxylase related protein n=1 Tax=Paenibacillus sp. 32352 TaxID=1969111 RepID=UPI0009AC8EBB|nr:S-adenosylmethionine decarboxylase related protein [Paenibacillus sp. 32352]
MQTIISILGSAGGVAKSILSILDKAYVTSDDPIHSMIRSSKLHFIDKKQRDLNYYKQWIPHLYPSVTLHQLDLQRGDLLRQHLIDTQTTVVIDVSWADTVDMLECCNELGISYINTALENTSVDENEKLEGFTLLERYLYFEKHRNRFTNTKAIVCSGMNPGVVQWMALQLMEQAPGERPLACYIVEQDNSMYLDPSLITPHTIYSTWSPECFLDEAILNYPMFVRDGMPLFIYDDVYALEFEVTLGSKKFHGCLMPHEEVLTLGQAFDMETGFIYRVNDLTTNAIRTHLDQVDDIWNWNHKVLDPAVGALEGEDLVGVLLVYKDKERYMYNVMDNKTIYASYKTNATYFQVACGIYGALATMLLDDIPNGVHYVDKLLLQTDTGYGRYLSRYMNHFVTGENKGTDGLLLKRLIKMNP